MKDVALKPVFSSISTDVIDPSPVLSNINLAIPRGLLVGLCGSVGSGKSSLLASVLGELRLVHGSVRFSTDVASLGIGYTAQEPWIQV